MNCKPITWTTRIIATLIIAPCIILSSSQPVDSDAANNWQVDYKALLARRASVDALQCHIRLTEYLSADEKAWRTQEVTDSWKQSVKSGDVPDGPLPAWYLPGNRCETYFWAGSSEKWLCDKSIIRPNVNSPILHDFGAFDGKKLFVYNEMTNRGYISDKQDDTNFINSIDSNDALDFGRPLSVLKFLVNAGAVFTYDSTENVSDETCNKYVAAEVGKKGAMRLIAWIAPRRSFALMKFQDEVLFKDSSGQYSHGNLFVYIVNKMHEEPGGFYVPDEMTNNKYKIINGVIHWTITDEYTINDIKVNPNVDQSLFEPSFPPGALVTDSTATPGSAFVVGGSWDNDAANGVAGLAPKAPLDGVTVKQPAP